MKKIVTVVLAVLLIAACTSTPVQNMSSKAIPDGLSRAQTEKAIIQGLTAKGWAVKSKTPGKIIGEIFVRTHRAEVAIEYNKNSYSINYVDSDNLNYDQSDNSIHKNYNKWIILLDRQIQNHMYTQTIN